MKKKALLSLLLIHFFSEAQTISTDNPLKTDLDKIVQKVALAYIKDNGNAALSIGVLQNNKAYTYNYGTIKFGEEILPTNHTLYEIGSISKTFTGTLVAQAIKDKKINLKDDIRKYLDGSYPNLEYNGHPIRIKDLNNHTSGLPKSIPATDLTNLPQDSIVDFLIRAEKGYTKERFLEELHQIKITSLPGTDYEYSNAGAQLMGYILEKVYNKSYPALLKEYITQPLKMTHTLVNPDPNGKDVIRGYNEKHKIMPLVLPNIMAAGGISSSTSDILQYFKSQLNKKNSVAHTAHQVTWGDPDTFAVGLFWEIETTFDNIRKLSHSGGSYGFSTYGGIYPDLNMGFVLLTNISTNTTQGKLDGIARSIFNQLHYTPAELAADDFGFPQNIKKLRNELMQKGFDQAITVANDFKAKNIKLVENDINNWGYHLMQQGENEKSLKIFKLNVYLHPESGNTYDSLGEFYERLGNKELAIQSYKRSFELDPNNKNAETHLKALEKS